MTEVINIEILNQPRVVQITVVKPVTVINVTVLRGPAGQDGQDADFGTIPKYATIDAAILDGKAPGDVIRLGVGDQGLPGTVVVIPDPNDP